MSPHEESEMLPLNGGGASGGGNQRRVFRSDDAWGWSLLVVGLLLAIILRVRLLEFPLERDEGEYAYGGQLMLQGIPPYKLAYTMKLPGAHAAYAAIMAVFGETTAGIHLGLLALNVATIALLFLLGRRLINSRAGGVAAATYAVLSVNPSTYGFAGHATHFVVLPVLGGALLLLRALDRQSRKLLFASGALFGIGLLMKQPALFFVLFGAGYLFYRDWRARRSLKNAFFRNALFSCSAILPLAIACFFLWRAGVFATFWFWTVDYADEYGGLTPPLQGIRLFLPYLPSVVGSGWPLWIMAGIGLIICLRHLKTCASAPFIIAFLGFSVLAVCPGFYFRQHYFILLLPSISILASVVTVKATDFCIPYRTPVPFLPMLLFGAALAFPLYVDWAFFVKLSPTSACRMAYGTNPFPESVRIAEYLHQHTGPEDTIAVLGSEPQIYFYAHRHSATGYIYMYGLMERQKYALQMQREMIQEIESARPKYLVFVTAKTSWLDRPDSERLVFRWFDEYSSRSYTAAGLVNIVSSDRTDYYLQDSSGTVPLSPCHIAIYKRNGP